MLLTLARTAASSLNTRVASLGVRFASELWRYSGDDGWHFVTLPAEITDEIRARGAGLHRPFGSLPVQARMGEVVTWRTSLFADKKRDAYLLPVKAEVRRRADVSVGDVVDVHIDLLT